MSFERKKFSGAAWFYILLYLAGCQSSERTCKNEAGRAKTQIPVKITRLEAAFDNLTDSTQALAVLRTNAALFGNLFFNMSGNDTGMVASELLRQSRDPYRDTLLADVMQAYPSLEGLEGELGDLFGQVKASYPAFVTPKVYTLVSGFTIDINYQRNILALGLEFFMPATARYPVPEAPGYIARRLRQYTLSQNVALVMSSGYNKPITGKRILDEMMRWGKIYCFIEQTMPCLPDTLLTGYPAATLTNVQENEKTIYNHFIANKLFYQDQPFLVNKYCGERPSIPEIGDKCPGRIGRYLGWRIVRQYAKENKLTLAQLMEETDADKIFREAGWRP